MGCDIHIFTEVKRYKYKDTERKNGVWISADTFKVNPDHILYEEGARYEVEEIYNGRDYRLFSILANVRNFYTEKIEPIAEPKGFPDDASADTKSIFDYWGSDAHSASWLTLQELLGNKDRFNQTGFVEAIEKLHLLTREHRSPEFEIREEDVRIVFWFDN